jgi:hypothetical protein
MGNPNSNQFNNNRQRLGNIINRVFESAGPDGKVRGTPQQIIDKYQALARDAQVAGDRVAAESYLQHSEHYSRLLGEAQRQQAENRQNERGDDQQRGDDQGQQRGDDQQRSDDQGQQRGDDGRQYRGDDGQGGNQRRQQPAMAAQSGSGLTMIEPEDSDDVSGPIDTPENRRSPRDEPAPVMHAERPVEQAQNGPINGTAHAPQGDAPEQPVKRPRPRRRAKADTAPAEAVSQAE